MDTEDVLHHLLVAGRPFHAVLLLYVVLTQGPGVPEVAWAASTQTQCFGVVAHVLQCVVPKRVMARHAEAARSWNTKPTRHSHEHRSAALVDTLEDVLGACAVQQGW